MSVIRRSYPPNKILDLPIYFHLLQYIKILIVEEKNDCVRHDIYKFITLAKSQVDSGING